MGSEQELLQTLQDIEAIKQLKARYFRTLDTKAWDDFADVFTDDVRIDVDGFTFEGRVELRRPAQGNPGDHVDRSSRPHARNHRH